MDEKYGENRTRKNINYGISILRVVLSLMVVIDHFYRNKRRYISILYYHIPTFFLISSYYTYNTFSKKDISKIKLRFARIIIPYFGWSVISFILSNIYFYLFKDNTHHNFQSFLINIISGRIFINALWLQNILIFISLVFSIIVFSFKKNLLIFQILFIICYYLQYSGFNFYYFKRKYSHLFYYTYGRVAEVFPNAITGYFLAYFKIYEISLRNRTSVIIISLFSLAFVTQNNLDKQLMTFRYGGLRKNIAAACIFLIFLLLPLEKIKSKKIYKIIDIFTGYTAGIYFSHLLIGKGKIMNFILDKKINDFIGCILIYTISFIASYFFGNLFHKTKLVHMFK